MAIEKNASRLWRGRMTGSSRTPGGSSLPRYPALDLLRGGAVIAVVSFHSFISVPSTGGRLIDEIATVVFLFLPHALDLFFVISGCLITLILDKTRGACHTVRTFYVRRALRIVPLYYGFLLLAHVFLRGLGPTAVGPAGSTKWEWLFLTNFALGLNGPEGVGALFPHFWSLAVEEHFYLVWPWLVTLTSPRRMLTVCVVLAITSVAGRLILALEGLAYASWLLTPTRLEGLALGSAVALIHVHRPEILKRWASRAMKWALAAFTPVLAVAIYFTGKLVGDVPQEHAALVLSAAGLVISPFLFSILFALIVAVAINRTGQAGGMAASFLASVARYSYGMYAFHVPLIVILFHTGRIPNRYPLGGFELPYRLLFAVAILSLSYLAGLLSWHLYEKQFLKLAPSYRYPARHPAPGPRESELLAIPVP